MSPLSTKNKRQKRKLDKDFYGDEVARRLNEAMHSPSVLRVRALIELLKAFSEKSAHLESFCVARKLMESGGAYIFANSPLGQYKRGHPEVAELAAPILKIADEIGSLLARYHWRPSIRVSPEGTLEQVTRWSQFNKDEDAEWESATVQWLLSELPTSPQGKGPFMYFAHCERCGNWFYAGREGAKFCRDACRVMSHTQTNEGRMVKARYMRESRAKARKRKEEAQLRKKRLAFPSKEPPKSTGPKQRKGRI
jgi:hypothetical protein